MFTLFVSVKVKPEMRDQFLAAMEEDATGSVRDEPGCLRFDVLQDLSDPDRYYFYEVYRDEEAFQAHMKMPHLAGWLGAKEVCLAEPTQAIRCSTVFPREGT